MFPKKMAFLAMVVFAVTCCGIITLDNDNIKQTTVEMDDTTFEYNHLTYMINEDKFTVTLIGYTTVLWELTIPKEVMYESVTYIVTAIGNRAIYACKLLTSITIPDSVKTIGDSAFSGCSGLTSLSIGDGVEAIGSGAFENCIRLTGALNIPGSVRTIGDSAFIGCGGLTSLSIGDGVEAIGSGAFENCYRLEGTLNIPGSVRTIGDFAFIRCREITNIEVSHSNYAYESIDGVLFTKGGSILIQAGGSYKSANYTVPNSVVCIKNNAFNGCSGLTGTLTIPNSVRTIEYFAFSGCSGLTSLSIGDGVEAIGSGAFENCYRLEGTLNIPDSVNDIDGMAFSGCNGLTKLIIASSVSNISNNTFDKWNFYDVDGITKITNMDHLPGFTYTGTTSKMVKQVYCTLTFNCDGGSPVSQITAKYGTAIPEPANPTKAFYKFTCWEVYGSKVSWPYTLKSDIVMNAVWEKDETMITAVLLFAGVVFCILAAVVFTKMRSKS